MCRKAVANRASGNQQLSITSWSWFRFYIIRDRSDKSLSCRCSSGRRQLLQSLYKYHAWIISHITLIRFLSYYDNCKWRKQTLSWPTIRRHCLDTFIYCPDKILSSPNDIRKIVSRYLSKNVIMHWKPQAHYKHNSKPPRTFLFVRRPP